MYRALGFAHATTFHELHRANRPLITRDDGQGTVEYIGLILLIAGVMAAVVGLGGGDAGRKLASSIVGHLQSAVDDVGKSK